MVRFQFVRDHSVASQAIGWFSSGHFSHVDALLDDARLLGARSDAVGGQPPGVRIRPPDYSAFTDRVIFTLPATRVQETEFRGFLAGQIGKAYDRRAIWAFAFNRNWRENDTWICSELQSAALEHAGLTPRLYLAANKITPVALALALSAIGAFFTCAGPAPLRTG